MLCLCLFSFLKGKGTSLGVGRGRAIAMRAKVSASSVFTAFTCKFVVEVNFEAYLILILLDLRLIAVFIEAGDANSMFGLEDRRGEGALLYLIKNKKT